MENISYLIKALKEKYNGELKFSLEFEENEIFLIINLHLLGKVFTAAFREKDLKLMTLECLIYYVDLAIGEEVKSILYK